MGNPVDIDELTKQMVIDKAKKQLEDVIDYLVEDNIKWNRGLTDEQVIYLLAEAAEQLKDEVND